MAIRAPVDRTRERADRSHPFTSPGSRRPSWSSFFNVPPREEVLLTFLWVLRAVPASEEAC